MTRVLITAVAAIAAAVVLAGCGGGSGNGTAGATVGTPAGAAGGVAGVQTTKNSATFRAQVTSLRSKLGATLKKLRNGDVAGAANVGGSLLTTCRSTVNDQLAPNATTTAQKQAVSHLRTACEDLSKASMNAASGDMTTTKKLARQALDQMNQAVKQLR